MGADYIARLEIKNNLTHAGVNIDGLVVGLKFWAITLKRASPSLTFRNENRPWTSDCVCCRSRKICDQPKQLLLKLDSDFHPSHGHNFQPTQQNDLECAVPKLFFRGVVCSDGDVGADEIRVVYVKHDVVEQFQRKTFR